MRRFYDPATLASSFSSAGATSGVQAGFGIFDAIEGYKQSQAAADEVQAQAQAEQISTDRKLRDDKRATRLRLSRMRAVIASTGADAGATGLLLTGAAEAGRRAQRIESDSSTRQGVLRAKASNIKRTGLIDAVTGLGSTAVGSYSTYNKLSSQKEDYG